MRKYLHVDLNQRSVREEPFEGEQIARAGRYFIAKTLVDLGVAKVDPLGPDNPLIFSAGPFAGSNFSNANRTSVGCKSPLTGGVKEANAGGSFGLALGQLEIAGFTLYGASEDWTVMYLHKDGSVSWDDAAPYLGKGTFETAEMLHEKYGNKVSLAICGPVGEYGGLLAGISMSDTDRRPTRLAARGGVGAVMGAKKVKAIVVDLDKMPTFHDRKKLLKGIKQYGQMIRTDEAVNVLKDYGTAMMADYTNYVGGLPVNNFTSGRQIDPAVGLPGQLLEALARLAGRRVVGGGHCACVAKARPGRNLPAGKAGSSGCSFRAALSSPRCARARSRGAQRPRGPARALLYPPREWNRRTR